MVVEQRVSGSELKGLEQTRVSVERVRIQTSNRVSAHVRGDDKLADEIDQFYAEMQVEQEEREKRLEALIARQVHTYPVWDYWLKDVKGIREPLAAQMLSILLPPLEDRGPSTWYKAAGLTVEPHLEMVNGEEVIVSRLPRARAGGGKITYHKWLRRCLHNTATSFVRVGGYYREVYDTRKRELFRKHAPRAYAMLVEWENQPVKDRLEWIIERYGVDRMKKLATKLMTAAEKKGGMTIEEAMEKLRVPTMALAFDLEGDQSKANLWPMFRIDSVARWMMLKLFLSHLYEMWLESEGKTGRQAYVVEKLGHHYIAPPKVTEKGKKI